MADDFGHDRPPQFLPAAFAMQYCPGCNEKVADTIEQRCPLCGSALPPISPDATQAWSALAGRETYFECEPAEPDDSLVGRQLANYLLERLAGCGGMGRVYEARHLLLHRQCAVKVLNQELRRRSPHTLEQFYTEARAAAQLAHPHVVAIYAVGEADGLVYIEMEYVTGRSLWQVVQDAGPFAPEAATRLMTQTCSALAEAHRRGMVHRDIKPANILLDSNGCAKLADFGLAKRLVLPDGHAETGLSGTPNYMAPELFDGAPSDPRSDVYAMGVTYFALLTGRLPFTASSIEDIARQHASAPAPAIGTFAPETPPEAACILDRCLAKLPADRYQDARALWDDLRSVYSKMRDTESLVREALAGVNLQIEGCGDKFVATVELASGRKQKVAIESPASAQAGERLIKVFSVCAPLRESYFRRALELNATIGHGSVAIENVDGEPHFVMVDTYPRVSCDPEEIRRSVLTIARWADEVELVLTGRDDR